MARIAGLLRVEEQREAQTKRRAPGFARPRSLEPLRPFHESDHVGGTMGARRTDFPIDPAATLLSRTDTLRLASSSAAEAVVRGRSMKVATLGVGVRRAPGRPRESANRPVLYPAMLAGKGG